LVVARVGAVLLLLAGALMVLRPFLIPMAWAAIVAYVTWPLYSRVRDWTGQPATTATVFTLAVLFGLGIPVGWVLVALAEQGASLIQLGQEWLQAGMPLPDWIAANTWLAPRLERLRQVAIPTPEQLTSHLATIGAETSQRLFAIAGGVASNVLAFVITLVSLFAFYVDGERLTQHARRLATELIPGAAPRFVDDVGSVVRAVVFGLVGTAMVQGLLAGIGLAIFGVPSPVALGALTMVLSFVPMGPVFVWGGATGWLFFLAERTGAAVGMALWGVLLVSSVDNVLRPILIGRSGGIRVPFLLVFFGVLGGLGAFGLLGLFLGPVLLTVVFTLISELPASQAPAPAAAAAPAPPPAPRA
jgi:predicted PurR-regulated permease PerM